MHKDILGHGVNGAYYRMSLYMCEVIKTAAIMRKLDRFLMQTYSPEARLVPHVDTCTHLVYVPCCGSGIQVLRRNDNDRLVTVRTLTCVTNVLCLCLYTNDTVLVGDATNKLVCLVHGTMNRVIRKVPPPEDLGATPPRCISTMKEQILVCYDRSNLVIYCNNGFTPGRVIKPPDGLGTVSSITTDRCSVFLLASGNSIFVLDYRGKLRHIIDVDAGSQQLINCAVAQSELWLFYEEEFTAFTTVTVMTSAKGSWKHRHEPGEGTPMLTQKNIYDVFVTYSTHGEERSWVHMTLRKKLEDEHGLKLCIHYRDFKLAGSIDELIVDAVNKSKKTLLILSPEFINSSWCHFEFRLACQKMISDRQDSLVIVIFRDLGHSRTEMPTMLAKLIEKKLYMKWTDDPGQQKLFWRRLVDTIRGTSYDAFNALNG